MQKYFRNPWLLDEKAKNLLARYLPSSYFKGITFDTYRIVLHLFCQDEQQDRNLELEFEEDCLHIDEEPVANGEEFVSFHKIYPFVSSGHPEGLSQ